MDEHPGRISGKDVHGAVSKIGNATDAERQVESHGHQSKNGAVDHCINDRADKHLCDAFRVLFPNLAGIKIELIQDSRRGVKN